MTFFQAQQIISLLTSLNQGVHFIAGLLVAFLIIRLTLLLFGK